MRNLSYRETAIALVLISAASAASYRLWFVPALAQIERDRRTLEGLVAVLAKPAKTSDAAASRARSSGPALSAEPALSPPPSRPPKPTKVPGIRAPKREPARPRCDARDPLCGDLEL